VNRRAWLHAATLLPAGTFVGRAVEAQDLIPIRIASAPADDVTPGLYAIHADLFKNEGLSVQFDAMANGAAVAAAVVGGSLQFGQSGVLTPIAAYLRGIPFKFVAPTGVYVSDAPYALMLVKKDSPIRSARDLNGKTIAAPSVKDLNAVAQLLWIDRNGGDSKSVRQIELTYAAMLPALDEGRVDAAMLLQPALQAALESGRTRVLAAPHDAIAKRFTISGWFTTAQYIATNGDAVRRFARALRAAAIYANRHHAETVPLLAAFTGIEPQTIERSTREVFAETFEPRDFQPVIDAAASYHAIERRFDAREIIA
jgi:NitT/TauT family transport system substrate-binding protein